MYKLEEFKTWLRVNGVKNFSVNPDKINPLIDYLEYEENKNKGFFNKYLNNLAKKDISQLDKKHSDYLILTWKNEIDKPTIPLTPKKLTTEFYSKEQVQELLNQELNKHSKLWGTLEETITRREKQLGYDKLANTVKEHEKKLDHHWKAIISHKERIVKLDTINNNPAPLPFLTNHWKVLLIIGGITITTYYLLKD